MKAGQFRYRCLGVVFGFALLGQFASAQGPKKPATPENVVFEPGIEFANPAEQHLKLDLASRVLFEMSQLDRPSRRRGWHFRHVP